MRTTQEWWQATKSSPAWIERWLRRQYRGEVTAAARIRSLARERGFELPVYEASVLEQIALDEEKHAKWIGELLVARDVDPTTIPLEDAERRYWSAALRDSGRLSFAELCGVGAHAERMRLERIRVIVADAEGPADIRQVFERILPDEARHAARFAGLAGDDAMHSMWPRAAQARALLGLVA